MIFLKDVIDFNLCAGEIAKSIPPSNSLVSASLAEIGNAFELFFNSDERSEFWYYTKEQCHEVQEEMISEFIADHDQNAQLTFAAKVAISCGLELIDEPLYKPLHPGWI